MVEGLQEKSTNAVTAISRGQELTQDSLTHSAEVVEALEQIGNIFNEINTLTSQIASAEETEERTLLQRSFQWVQRRWARRHPVAAPCPYLGLMAI